jgi:shikimate dehydrogenase
MRVFGLIGHPLGHSFSKKYFTEKFQNEGIRDAQYHLFDIESIGELKGILATRGLKGLNVTIPYKSQIIPCLDDQDAISSAIGAVNVVKSTADSKLIGYNSDYFGFRDSLERFLPKSFSAPALILGTGGASMAVEAALDDLKIPYQRVSRSPGDQQITYSEVGNLTDFKLIINTTPLGMTPNTESCPDLEYESIGSDHFLYDLVYNPEETLFMKKGIERGAHVLNGLEMLHLQAEKSWEIWNS